MTTISAEPRDTIADALGQPTLCAALDVTAHAHPDRVAIRMADGSLEWTWSEYRARVKAAAAGLAAHGVGPGDAVALLLTNRPEALVVDLAAMHLGAIAFSVYNTIAPDQILPLLENSGARVLVTEPAFLEVARATRDVKGELELIVVGGDGFGGADEETFTDLCARRAPEGFDFEAAWRSNDPDTIVTIVYTPGTTGPPKGVQHTHAGLLYGLRCTHDLSPVSPAGRVVSHLPMAHVAERLQSHYGSLVFGLQITCCPDPTQLLAALAVTRPTRFLGVPRNYEKLAAAIAAMAQAHPDGLLASALGGAIDVVRARQAGAVVPAVSPRDRDVLAALRAELGLDALEWAAVAAAPTPTETLEVFHAIGVDLLEFWGMSECMVGISNPPGRAKLGSIGLPVPGVEIALAADGELLVRGKNVMVGYRHRPDETRATIDDDGWMYSGDIARVDEDGYHWLVDRKQELIVNAAGESVAPSKIETAIEGCSPLVAQVVAIGDGRPYVTALLVLDEDAAMAFARRHGLPDDVDVVAADELARALVAEAVARGNRRLAHDEQVKAHAILPVAWRPGGDELTPTMKLKRRPIAAKYAAQIDALYVTAHGA